VAKISNCLLLKGEDWGSWNGGGWNINVYYLMVRRLNWSGWNINVLFKGEGWTGGG